MPEQDIVERLLHLSVEFALIDRPDVQFDFDEASNALIKAAGNITELRAERDRYRKALEPFGSMFL